MPQTVRDVVKRSLRAIRRYGRGQNLPPEDAEDAREILNSMLAKWSAEGTVVPTLQKLTATLTAGKQDYSVGTGADLVITRPTAISALILIDGNSRYPLLPWTMHEYTNLRSTSNALPVFYAYQYDTLGRLYLDAPPDKAYTAEIWAPVPLSQFTSLNDDMELAFDDADIDAVYQNLAVRMAPEWNAKITETLAQNARDSYKAIGIRYTEPLVYVQ